MYLGNNQNRDLITPHELIDVRGAGIIKYIRSKTNGRRSKKSKATLAGWLCFIIGMILMFISLGIFFIYAPLFLAAFILSIIAMTKGRVVNGIFLLLFTIAIPSITWFSLVVLKIGQTIEEQEIEKQTALSKIVFEDVKGYDEGDFMYLEGKVRNNGDTNVDYIKVGVEWKDVNGKILDTDWTYAVGGEGLSPGAAKSFKIMTTRDRKMQKFRYYLMED